MLKYALKKTNQTKPNKQKNPTKQQQQQQQQHCLFNDCTLHDCSYLNKGRCTNANQGSNKAQTFKVQFRTSLTSDCVINFLSLTHEIHKQFAVTNLAMFYCVKGNKHQCKISSNQCSSQAFTNQVSQACSL